MHQEDDYIRKKRLLEELDNCSTGSSSHQDSRLSYSSKSDRELELERKVEHLSAVLEQEKSLTTVMEKKLL